MNLNKIKKDFLAEKEVLLGRYKLIEAYLIDRINVEGKSADREASLKTVQHSIDELEHIINFLKK